MRKITRAVPYDNDFSSGKIGGVIPTRTTTDEQLSVRNNGCQKIKNMIPGVNGGLYDIGGFRELLKITTESDAWGTFIWEHPSGAVLHGLMRSRTGEEITGGAEQIPNSRDYLETYIYRISGRNITLLRPPGSPPELQPALAPVNYALTRTTFQPTGLDTSFSTNETELFNADLSLRSEIRTQLNNRLRFGVFIFFRVKESTHKADPTLIIDGGPAARIAIRAPANVDDTNTHYCLLVDSAGTTVANLWRNDNGTLVLANERIIVDINTNAPNNVGNPVDSLPAQLATWIVRANSAPRSAFYAETNSPFGLSNVVFTHVGDPLSGEKPTSFAGNWTLTRTRPGEATQTATGTLTVFGTDANPLNAFRVGTAQNMINAFGSGRIQDGGTWTLERPLSPGAENIRHDLINEGASGAKPFLPDAPMFRNTEVDDIVFCSTIVPPDLNDTQRDALINQLFPTGERLTRSQVHSGTPTPFKFFSIDRRYRKQAAPGERNSINYADSQFSAYVSSNANFKAQVAVATTTAAAQLATRRNYRQNSVHSKRQVTTRTTFNLATFKAAVAAATTDSTLLSAVNSSFLVNGGGGLEKAPDGSYYYGPNSGGLVHVGTRSSPPDAREMYTFNINETLMIGNREGRSMPFGLVFDTNENTVYELPDVPFIGLAAELGQLSDQKGLTRALLLEEMGFEANAIPDTVETQFYENIPRAENATFISYFIPPITYDNEGGATEEVRLNDVGRFINKRVINDISKESTIPSAEYIQVYNTLSKAGGPRIGWEYAGRTMVSNSIFAEETIFASTSVDRSNFTQAHKTRQYQSDALPEARDVLPQSGWQRQLTSPIIDVSRQNVLTIVTRTGIFISNGSQAGDRVDEGIVRRMENIELHPTKRAFYVSIDNDQAFLDANRLVNIQVFPNNLSAKPVTFDPLGMDRFPEDHDNGDFVWDFSNVPENEIIELSQFTSSKTGTKILLCLRANHTVEMHSLSQSRDQVAWSTLDLRGAEEGEGYRIIKAFSQQGSLFLICTNNGPVMNVSVLQLDQNLEQIFDVNQDATDFEREIIPYIPVAANSNFARTQSCKSIDFYYYDCDPTMINVEFLANEDIRLSDEPPERVTFPPPKFGLFTDQNQNRSSTGYYKLRRVFSHYKNANPGAFRPIRITARKPINLSKLTTYIDIRR